MRIRLLGTELCFWDIIALFICSIPAFYLLGTPAIYIWDEAVYSNASIDMSHGHSFWVPAQETYNTKPPLVLWLQAGFLSFLPWPELAVRLPSAMAVVGIMVLLIVTLRRWGFDQWTRIIVLVCFVANNGFIRHHIGRTGDLDAVMTFFETGYALIVLDAIHFKKWNSRYAFWFFVMMVFSFYAKSIAGWIMLGPILVIWLISPIRNVLWSGKFILGGICTLLICGFYYLSREWMQPGFMQLAWHSEYLRMFSNVMPWHAHGFGYYFRNFVTLQTYTPWIFMLIAACVFNLAQTKDIITKNHISRWIILSLGYLLFISVPADKLEWYDAPVYPFFALIIGVTFSYINEFIPKNIQWFWGIPLVLLIFLKLNFIHHDLAPKDPFEYEGNLLRKIKDLNDLKVFMPVKTIEHRLQLDFYRKTIHQKSNREIIVLDSLSQLNPGDRLILNADNLKKVSALFNIDTLGNEKDLAFEVRLQKKN